MKFIGLLSDTHYFLHPRIFDFFNDCDEIWHAGDIGNLETIDKLTAFKQTKAVYGNMDGYDVRANVPKNQRFYCENVDVWITHIGGYPDNYSQDVREEIKRNPPKLFIAGHSHILKVIFDKKLNLLHINPGAAGRQGIHKQITFVRFKIDKDQIKQLEIMEIPKTKIVLNQ
jgi:uncharacterized protein